MNYKEEDLLLCTVKKIENTTVFIETEEGFPCTLTFSEISAGRIRNIREFVSIGKKIVCKVLKIQRDHLEMTMRRVTARERDHILEKYKKESTFKKILSSNVKDSEKIIENIKKDQELADFFEEAKTKPEVLNKYLSKEDSEKIKSILSEKKDKDKSVKKTFSLSSNSPSGVSDIKTILSGLKDSKISYLGSSRFTLETSASDFKEAEKKLSDLLIIIESRAKEKKALFSQKEK